MKNFFYLRYLISSLQLSRLLEELSIENVEKESVNLTLSPLLENSHKLIDDPQMNQNVKKAVQNLLNMTEFSMKLNASNTGFTNSYLDKVLCKSYGVKKRKEKQMINVKLEKNHETNLLLTNTIIKNRHFNESLKAEKRRMKV